MLPHTGSKADSVQEAKDSGMRRASQYDRKAFIAASALAAVSTTVRGGIGGVEGVQSVEGVEGVEGVKGVEGLEGVHVFRKKLLNV